MLIVWARTLHARALHPWTPESHILSWWTEEIIDMEELKVDADSNRNILKGERNQRLSDHRNWFFQSVLPSEYLYFL